MDDQDWDLDEDEDEEPAIEIAVAYYGVSGAKAWRCAFLAMRYDAEAGYRPLDGETWISATDGEVDPANPDVIRGRTLFMNGTAAWYTGLWSTLSGSVYVTVNEGWVSRNPDIYAADAVSHWQSDRIEGRTLHGVFGIDDSNVFVWGHDPVARSGEPYPASEIFRWDGQGWSPMQGPGFHIMAMHGTATDNLWVGGPRGVVARWDGGRWTQLPSRHDELINSIWVAGPDEVYATTAQGTVLEGSAAGMLPIGPIPGAVLPGDVACVAKWKGELWVGANRLGLFRRVGTTRDFESIKPNIDCVSMDARAELVLCCNNRVAGTANGVDFRSYGRDSVLNFRAPYRLGENLG